MKINTIPKCAFLNRCYNVFKSYFEKAFKCVIENKGWLNHGSSRKEWYLEYEITINRAGLLGDISSLLGMLGISIVTINGVDQGKRGLLIKTDKLEKVERFEQIVKEINEIDITKLRIPELRDRLAVRHGRYIEQDADDKNV